MGERNTISLLTSINGYLKALSEEAKQNKGPGEVQKQNQVSMTKKLNQGSVISGSTPTPKNGKYSDVAISAAMMASLNSLPTVILAIGKLKKKDVEAFTKTLLAIQVTINKFAEGSKDVKGADNLVKVIQSLSMLEKVGLIKLASSLKVANTFGFSKALIKFVDGVKEAANKAGSIKNSDLKKLAAISNNMKAFSTLTTGLAVIMGTVIAMAAAIKIFGEKQILKSVGITLGVLTVLTGIAIGVGVLAKHMTGATKGLREVAFFILLMQGAVLGTLLMGAIAQKSWPTILVGFGVIGGIILGYVAIAALASLLFKFITMNRASMMSVVMMAAYGMGITLGTLLVGYVAQKAWKDILIGFGVIGGIILGYVAIAALASFLFKFITINKEGLLSVVMMAGFGMGMVLGTLLVGFVAQKAWPHILTGFAAMAGVIMGYVGLAALVSTTAKLSPAFRKNIFDIAIMAGVTMGLILGTLLIGVIAQRAWKDIAIGFITIGLVMEGFALLGKLVSFTAKGLGRFRADFITLGIFAAECEALLLGVVAIAWVTKKAGVTIPELLVTLAGVASIVGGLLGIEKVLASQKMKDTTKAINTLRQLALIGFACEGLLAGIVGLAILAKKADPIYLVGVVYAMGLIVGGLVAMTEFIEKHNRSLQKGATNLLLVEAVGLGAEALLAGMIGLAKLMDDPKLAIQLPVTIGMIAGIIYGVIHLVKIVEKNKKDIQQGAKSMLLVEAVALGAEAILGGIIGLIWLQKKADISFLEVVGVTTIIAAIVTGLVGIIKLVEKHNKDLQKGARSMLLVEAVAFGAEAILAGIIGLIWLQKQANIGTDEILGVTFIIGGIVLGLVGVLKLVEKNNKSLEKGAKSLLLVVACAAGAGLVLAEIIGIETLRRVANVEWSDITYNVIAMTTIVGLFGALAGIAGKFDKQIRKGIISLALVEALAAGAGLLLAGVIGLVALKNAVGTDWDEITNTVGAMIGIVGTFAILAALVGGLKQLFTKAIPGIVIITLFALSSEALLAGVIGLVALKNAVKADWGDIFATIGAMSTIVVAFGALAALVGVTFEFIVPGIIGLPFIVVFALASGVLLAGVIGLVALKNAAKADWGDIFATIGAMATIVTAFGLLAAAVGAALPFVALGIVGIIPITLLAASSELLLAGVLKLVDYKNKIKAEWKDVFTMIGAMATVTGLFGALGTAIGIASPAIALGLLGIIPIVILSQNSKNLLEGIIELINKKNEYNVSWDDVNDTLEELAKVVGIFGALGAAITAATLLIAPAILSVPSILSLGASSEMLLGGIINIVNKKNESNVEWKDIDETLDKLKDIIISFEIMAGVATLATPAIILGSKGIRDISKAAVNVSKALTIICKASANTKGFKAKDTVEVIKNFEAVTDALFDMMGIEFAAKATAIGAQTGLIQKISNASVAIATGLSKMAGVAKEGGFLRPMHIKANGDIVYGQWINAKGSAQTLADTMGFFVNTLYDAFDKLDDNQAKRIENGTKLLQSFIEPVSNFAVALSAFESVGDGKIRQIKYDENGKLIDTKAVDVKSVAQTIASSISAFCSTLFTEENQKVWERMVQGGSYSYEMTKSDDTSKSGLKYNPGAAHNAMGIFAIIVDPIAKFAQTLAMFEEGTGENLRIPIYDKEGNITGYREINVVSVATKIASAVGAFNSALIPSIMTWTAMYQANNQGPTNILKSESWAGSKEYETVAGSNHLADAMGVFAGILTPIISFTQLLSSFGDVGADELNVYNSEGKLLRKIKPAQIADVIAGAIGKFISTLTTNLTSGKQMSELDKLTGQKDTLVSAVDLLSKALESLGNIDAENATKFYTAFGDIMGIVYSIGDKSNTELVKSATSSIKLLSDTMTEMNNVMEGESNPTLLALTGINTMLKEISKDSEGLSNIITFFTDLKAQSESFSNVIDSSVVASITNLCTSLPQASDALRTAKGEFNKAINDKKTGIKTNADRTTHAFNRTTLSITNFDRALSGNNSKRIKNIDNLTSAVMALDEATDGIESRLESVASALRALSTISTANAAENIERVINALAGAGRGGGGYNSGESSGESGGGTVGIGQQGIDAIADAIAKAFDGTEFRYKNENNTLIKGMIDVPNVGSGFKTSTTMEDYNEKT